MAIPSIRDKRRGEERRALQGKEGTAHPASRLDPQIDAAREGASSDSVVRKTVSVGKRVVVKLRTLC